MGGEHDPIIPVTNARILAAVLKRDGEAASSIETVAALIGPPSCVSAASPCPAPSGGVGLADVVVQSLDGRQLRFTAWDVAGSVVLTPGPAV